MHGSRSQRAAWRGWFVSLLLHGLAAAGVVYAFRHAPAPQARIQNAVCPGPEFNITMFDEPVRILAPKSTLSQPPEPIQPVYVAAPTRPANSTPLIPPVEPGSVAPKPIEPPPIIRPKPMQPAQPVTAAPGPVAGFTATGAGGGPSGQPGRLPVNAAVKSVVFVLDRSASMGIDDRIGVARAEILASLRRLGPGARFQVVVYNRTAESLRLAGRTGLAPINARTIAELIAALDELVPEGGNDHAPALQAALALEPDVVCLLTDADDLTLPQVKAITLRNRGRSVICAVTIGSAPRQAMQLLAAWNKGTCERIDTRRDPVTPASFPARPR